MEGLAAGGLEDLFAATEAVGDDEGFIGGLADGWEEDSLADG